MKLILVVALNIILLNALNVRSPQQQALFSESLVAKLKTTNLGRALFLLAQVHGEQSDVNFNQLFDSLDMLADSFKNRILDENQEYSQLQSNSQSDQQFYTKQVDQYETEVAQHNIDVHDLTKQREELEATLQNKKDELTECKKQQEQLQNVAEEGAKSFKQSSDDSNQVISVIDQALDLLEKARDSSFTQLHQESYKDVSLSMHNTLSKMYEPIAQMLAQIGSSGFADQEKLTKVVKLLQGLRDSLIDSRSSLTNAYENEKQQNEDILHSYDAKSTQLSDVIVVGLQSDIEVKITQIQTKQSLLAGAQANQDGAEQNLDSTTKIGEQQKATHMDLIDEYTKESAIVQQTVDALNEGGIQRSE